MAYQFVDPTTARISIPLPINNDGYIASGEDEIVSTKTFSISPSKTTATPEVLWLGRNDEAALTNMGIVKAIYFLAGVVDETDTINDGYVEDWKRTVTQIIQDVA